MDPEWNATIIKTWPYNLLIKELIDHIPPEVLNGESPLFYTKNFTIDFPLVISYACYFFAVEPPENSDDDSAIIDWVIEIIKKNKDKLDDILESARCYFSVTSKFGLLVFLHLLFTYPSRRIPSNIDRHICVSIAALDRLDGTYYDAELDTYIKDPVRMNRLYKSPLLRMVTNNLMLYSYYFQKYLKCSEKAEGLIVEKLLATRKGKSYALLDLEDKRQRVLMKTAHGCKYFNDELRICSNNKNLFEYICKVGKFFRDASEDKTAGVSGGSSGAPKEEKDILKRNVSYRKTKIKESVRKQVWEHYNTFDVAKAPCYVCSKVIDIAGYQCGHILSERDGGEAVVKNLLPICSLCNQAMGSEYLFEYARRHFEKSRCFELESYKNWAREASRNVVDVLDVKETINIPAIPIKAESPHKTGPGGSEGPIGLTGFKEVPNLKDAGIAAKVFIPEFLEKYCIKGPGLSVSLRNFHTEAKRAYTKDHHGFTVDLKAEHIKAFMCEAGYNIIKDAGNSKYAGLDLKKV